jgi:hypothetical protein
MVVAVVLTQAEFSSALLLAASGLTFVECRYDNDLNITYVGRATAEIEII